MALAVLVVAAGCGSSGSDADRTDGGGEASPITGTVTVSAAASLTEAFDEIGADFEAAHPGTTVRFTFDSSSILATQIDEGAPVDVFASADEKNMAKVLDADHLDGSPTIFARNELVIVTAPGNPAGIEGLADLEKLDIVSLCSVDAPCGGAAAEALTKAGVDLDEAKVTRGQNVKATLTAVTEGDAPAGIVYVTDATAAGDRVDTVAIPAADNVTVRYPVGVVADAPNAAAARAFAASLTDTAAQRVLADHGFLAPT